MTEWEALTGGASDARVHRRGGVVRKTTADAAVEASKLVWLAGMGVPVPEVYEIGDGYLLMAEVPGYTAADAWPTALRQRIIDGLAEVARMLHALPAATCPFDRTLEVTVAQAQSAVAAHRVNLDDLDEIRAGWTGSQLLDEVYRTRPSTEDLVVVHGDLCVPNVFFDPLTGALTGIIDVGRLGRADRYVDLAIATRSLLSVSLNPQYGPWAAERFLDSYGIGDPDRAMIEFYRLMDEFCWTGLRDDTTNPYSPDPCNRQSMPSHCVPCSAPPTPRSS